MDNQKILELYQSGASCQDIADYYNVSSQAISKRLKLLKVETRTVAGYYTPEQLELLRAQIFDLRAKDYTILEISKIVNLSQTSVWWHLKKTEK